MINDLHVNHCRVVRTAIPRSDLLVAVLVTAVVLAPARPTAAQTSPADATTTPSEAAGLFIRSVRAIRWDAAARFVAPETLDRFRTTVTMIADADTTGAIRTFLVRTDSAGLGALDPSEVFGRAVGAMVDDMPGLMHSLYDRDDEVLGHVTEGADTAHVVYRTTARLSGAVPEVKVMQLVRTPAGWRVLWSDELEVLEAALRGFVR